MYRSDRRGRSRSRRRIYSVCVGGGILLGRSLMLVRGALIRVQKLHTFLAFSPSFAFLPFGLGLFACDGVGGAPPEFGDDG